MIESLEDLERLLKLLDEHRVESFELNGLRIAKSTWSQPPPQSSRQGFVVTERDNAPTLDDDDVLYYAAD